MDGQPKNLVPPTDRGIKKIKWSKTNSTQNIFYSRVSYMVWVVINVVGEALYFPLISAANE